MYSISHSLTTIHEEKELEIKKTVESNETIIKTRRFSPIREISSDDVYQNTCARQSRENKRKSLESRKLSGKAAFVITSREFKHKNNETQSV